MIRDPSDGSIREPDLLAENAKKPVLKPSTSGLQTGSQKPENIARLERSREWLKNYFHRRNSHDRGSNEQERPTEAASAPEGAALPVPRV